MISIIIADNRGRVWRVEGEVIPRKGETVILRHGRGTLRLLVTRAQHEEISAGRLTVWVHAKVVSVAREKRKT